MNDTVLFTIEAFVSRTYRTTHGFILRVNPPHEDIIMDFPYTGLLSFVVKEGDYWKGGFSTNWLARNNYDARQHMRGVRLVSVWLHHALEPERYTGYSIRLLSALPVPLPEDITKAAYCFDSDGVYVIVIHETGFISVPLDIDTFLDVMETVQAHTERNDHA